MAQTSETLDISLTSHNPLVGLKSLATRARAARRGAHASGATQGQERTMRATRRALARAAVVVATLACAAVAVGATTRSAAPVAHASNGLYYQRGYSVQGGWLCYGWSSGAYHCTQRWHRSGGQLVSDNPSWVPNTSGVVLSAGGHPSQSSGGSAWSGSNAGEPCRSGYYFAGVPSQWATPPSCYGGVYYVNPANYVYRSGFGWCNWWPEVMNPGRPDLLWGGYRRGWAPAPGATVVFAPGVQGAGSDGHYGRVVAVYPGGYWMLISEMNFFWRGAGFARVSYRYVHTGYGVSFIY